jgi:uncharacterized protein
MGFILEQKNNFIFEEAEKFISIEKGVNSVIDALEGARDIIAEIISENALVRESIRDLFKKTANIKSKVIKGKEDVGEKFNDYFQWEEKLMSCPSHRLLAMRRGEKEDILILDLVVDTDEALSLIEKKIITSRGEAANQLKESIIDGYKRLLNPSIEAEMRLHTKQIAEEKSILVFADNLRELLLASPLGEKAILGIELDKEIEEFEKAEIIVKTVRLKENNLPKEDISFPNLQLVTLTDSPIEVASEGSRDFVRFYLPIC